MHKRFIFICGLWMVAACAPTHSNIANSAVEYNKAVERAQNEMLLLNIVRASKKRPMHFTKVNLLRGQWTSAHNASATFPFGDNVGNLSNFGMVGGSYSSTPSFDLTVQNDKEFMTGILSPVQPNIVMRYWEQDFNPEVLLYLLVRRLDYGKTCLKSNPWMEIEAYQDDQYCQTGLQAALRKHLYEDRLDIVWQKEQHAYGPVLSAEMLADSGKLVNIDNSDLRLVPAGEGYRLMQKDKRLALRFQKQNTAHYLTEGQPEENADGSFTLRSPQGILYYLGEVVRYDMLPPDDPRYVPSPKVCFAECDENDQPLFKLVRGTQPLAGAAVSVEYEGDWYSVPGGDEKSYSMYALSMIAELLALQSSAETLPYTGAVTIIGQ